MKKVFSIILILTFLFSVDYQTQIQPIFDSNCGSCHLSNSAGGLNLSNYENLMSNDVVVPGDHQASSLYERIIRPNSASGDMPPGNSELSQSEIDLIAQWIDEGALFEEVSDISGCMDPYAITCDDTIDSLYFPECNTCSDDDPCDNYYNPDATIDNGMCMYNVVPEAENFSISIEENGLQLDWSSFEPPVAVNSYVLMRCLDEDGDSDNDGEFEYEFCYFILNPTSNYLDRQFLDEFDSQYSYSLEETAAIKYTLSIFYPNNNYWGSAFGNYYFVNDGSTDLLMGDLNYDSIINVIDIVTMVNGILGGSFTADQIIVADLNSDGVINVIDIVSLVNIILD